MKVLIAENSLPLRSSLVRVVRSLPGYKDIYEAENYHRLRRICTKKTPDLIVMDLFLTGGTGFAMIGEALALCRNCQLVVLLDDYDDSLAERVRKEGAHAVFSKSDHLLASMLKLNSSLQAERSTTHDQHFNVLEFIEFSQSCTVTHN